MYWFEPGEKKVKKDAEKFGGIKKHA